MDNDAKHPTRHSRESGNPESGEVRRYKFNVDQYYKMAEVGILPWEGREELLSGVVWDRSPLVRNRCHPSLNGGITRFLNELEGIEEEFDAHIHKYTAEEYQEMGKAGILTPDDRVELIDGEIVLMPPMLSRHAAAVNRNSGLFHRHFTLDQAIIWSQCPIRLLNNGEPEPDLALLKPRSDFYKDSLPTNHDVLLAVEMSDTTLRLDLNVKLPLYALHGIPELWLVNLRDDVLGVYRNPEGSAYQESTQLGPSDSVSPQAFPNIVLEVEDILG